MPFIPHTKEDISAMLQFIGVKKVDDLFSEVPSKLQTNLEGKLEPSKNELTVSKLLQKKADLDYGVSNYLGAGAYEHHIPAAVWEVTARGEFMTSYTPYQAEASQGNLQLIYEYQTMMCSLTAMDVSNASMYDGATALAESILMSVRSNRKTKSKTVLLIGAVHPYYVDTAKTIVSHQGIELVNADYDSSLGTVTEENLAKFADLDLAAVVVSQPNFYGQLEDVNTITNWTHSKNALLIAVVNPVSLGVLEAPGNWGDNGADIVCGEGQPLGVPLASGGPYFGFQCCRKDYVRQMPGRIVGCTVDEDGRRGFTLTLQAREQHIRRSKATSNICTNQGLLVTAATIYMSLLGAEGLERVAASCWHNTQYLANRLCEIPGISRKFAGDSFHESVLEFDRPLDKILAKLREYKIAGGINLADYSLAEKFSNCLLLCVTETKEQEDLDFYADTMRNIMQEVK